MTTHTQHTPGKGPALRFPDGLMQKGYIRVRVGAFMGGLGL
jgi:hypothetical protein